MSTWRFLGKEFCYEVLDYRVGSTGDTLLSKLGQRWFACAGSSQDSEHTLIAGCIVNGGHHPDRKQVGIKDDRSQHVTEISLDPACCNCGVFLQARPERDKFDVESLLLEETLFGCYEQRQRLDDRQHAKGDGLTCIRCERRACQSSQGKQCRQQCDCGELFHFNNLLDPERDHHPHFGPAEG